MLPLSVASRCTRCPAECSSEVVAIAGADVLGAWLGLDFVSVPGRSVI